MYPRKTRAQRLAQRAQSTKKKIAKFVTPYRLRDRDATDPDSTSAAAYGNRLGDIGAGLGISAVRVGKLLDQAGLRSAADKQPSERAIRDGFARCVQSECGEITILWHLGKVLAELRPMCMGIAEVDEQIVVKLPPGFDAEKFM